MSEESPFQKTAVLTDNSSAEQPKEEEVVEEVEEVEKNLTPDGGVRKLVLIRGTGPSPKDGDVAEVNYEGRLQTGEVFDASGGYPFSFALGKDKVIRGWEVAVPQMKRGERSRITISPSYGYGKKGGGEGSGIPAEATLVFEMELKDFKPEGSSARVEQRDVELARLNEVRRKRDEMAKLRAQKNAERAEKSKKAAQPVEKKGQPGRSAGKRKKGKK